MNVGATLPDEPARSYRRVLWPFELGDGDGRLELERRDHRFVRITVHVPSYNLSVNAHRGPGAALPRLRGSATVRSDGRGEVEAVDQHTIALPEGEAVRIEIEAAGLRVTTPELRP